MIELTGIGGIVEPADVSIECAAQREAREELGCNVLLRHCQETLMISGPNRWEWIGVMGNLGPAAIVLRNYKTPPHTPWHRVNQGRSCFVVYLSELTAVPQIGDGLVALGWLDAYQVFKVARRDVAVDHLLRSGARFALRGQSSIPSNAVARLTDSQEAIALALRRYTVSFYRDLC